MENSTLEMTLLFDFFGDLLTDKQREYFDLYYNQDLSLAEIAENEGISRQGVRDIITRASRVLKETEEKTGIIRRHLEIQDKLAEMEAQVSELRELNKKLGSDELGAVTEKLSSSITNLKG